MLIVQEFLISPQTKGLGFVVLNQGVSAGTKVFSIEGIWNVFYMWDVKKSWWMGLLVGADHHAFIWEKFTLCRVST